MFSEDELLPLSALQHLVFCERQCALIHIEQVWSDNVLTVEGTDLHKRVDEDPGETRGDLRIARGLPLRSFRLGLSGRADAVEFHGPSRLRPVEYKRGKPKENHADEVQLCAQALCLEEMLHATVPDGAIFYGQTRRRRDVVFSGDLRKETADAANRLHQLFDSQRTPRAHRQPKCERCSLLPHCMPDVLGTSAQRYLFRQIRQLSTGNETASGPSMMETEESGKG